MIYIKNINSNILKDNYGINHYFIVKNIEIEKPNVVNVIKNQQFNKIHRLFYEIISGEKFLQNYEFKLDYKIVNYYSLRKRYDFEQSVFDNFIKFFVEDSLNIKNINKNFKDLVKFLEFEVDDIKPLERYSTGQISKIIYSLPLFLNYDVYILSEIPLDADLTFENKVIEIIENLSKLKIFFFDFKFKNQNNNIFTKYLDFNILDNIHCKSTNQYQQDTDDLFVTKNDQVIKSNNLNKYLNNLDISFDNIIDKLEIENNFEEFTIKVNLSSKLSKDFTFKFGLNIRARGKTIISQTSAKWTEVNSNKEIKNKIIVPNIFVDDIYEFFLSVKVENMNERNQGKTFRIIENFLIARIKFFGTKSFFNSGIVKPEFIFETN